MPERECQVQNVFIRKVFSPFSPPTPKEISEQQIENILLLSSVSGLYISFRIKFQSTRMASFNL